MWACRAGCRRCSVSHLAVFSVSMPSSSARTSAAAAEGARPMTDRPVLGFPDGPQAGHGRGLAGPGRPDQHVEHPAGGGDLFDRHRLIGEQRSRLGRAGRFDDRGDGRRGDGRAAEWRPASRSRASASSRRGGGVDLVASGPEPGGPVGPAEAGRGVMQLGGGEQQRLAEGEVGGPLGHGDPLVGGGEADPVELAVDLGEHVGPGERGPPLGHPARRPPGDVGEDLVGQVDGRRRGRSLRSAKVATHDSGSSPT